MTPSDIEILIHYHVSQEVHPRIHAPAIQESIDRFIAWGILEPDTHKTTEKGHALIATLCNTEMPRQAWVDSNNNLIEDLWPYD